MCWTIFEKEVVLFLVFYLVSRCLSASLYFVRNQSLMWQETVLFEHKVIRKVLSLNKKKSSEVQEISLRKSMKIWTQLLITWCPLVVFLLHWYMFVIFSCSLFRYFLEITPPCPQMWLLWPHYSTLPLSLFPRSKNSKCSLQQHQKKIM